MSVRRVKALHPHWTGFLLLSDVDNIATHEGRQSKGKFKAGDGTLTVHWENFVPDVFVDVSGTYVHESLISGLPALDRIAAVTVGNRPMRIGRINLVIPDGGHEVSLRPQTSDIPTFFDIFVKADYASPNLPRSAATIVDLGANIGLATVFFGARYPGARLLAVEPEPANYKLLLENAAAFGDRVTTRCAAVWTSDGELSLHTEDSQGRSLGEWGAQVSDTRRGTRVPCFRLSTLLDSAGIPMTWRDNSSMRIMWSRRWHGAPRRSWLTARKSSFRW